MQNKLLVILFVLALTINLTGCGADKVEESKAALVKTQKVSLGVETESGTYSGSVRGRYETNMAFQVGGRIISRNVQLGDRVNPGDVLMVIDAKDAVQKSNQGDAQVAAARAQLNLAQTNLNRYRELYNQQAVAASVLDQYQTTYDSALASYENAVAQAAQGHNALGYTNLVSEAGGVISSISAESGQVVAAGQSVLTLIQTNELEVEINVPENHLADVAVGKTVDVSLWALKDSKKKEAQIAGVIREIAPMADTVSRTYKVRVSIPEPPSAMQLGMTASVTISQKKSDGADITILPMSAIYQTDDKPQVWVVDKESMTLYLKPVTMDMAENNKVKVTGLADGDIVVTAGVHKVMEGQKVRLSEDDGK
ncbi:MAG: efflux RND transporter periplasmic adaptor subunit [Selenomonadaceae bacterium]|nr:efflux RND transporter periplasmic adaptor subunit [Selenomonadaceae bacterium]